MEYKYQCRKVDNNENIQPLWIPDHLKKSAKEATERSKNEKFNK